MNVLPTRISHYEIRRVLGQGGMGVVYLAFDPSLQRQVALKVLRVDTDDQRERFRREARIAARLQHPNIVSIYAVGEHEQQLFIAMEYIEGEPLSEGIRRKAPWGLHRKLLMGVDLCEGLAFAHRGGIIHRDIKPSNLILTNGSGAVRLLDFGIARGADTAATMGLTMQGNIVGTLNYMSPEQITGQPLDHRSDIFAVGLVLYELLAYRQAFPGDNLATLTYRIVHGAAEPLISVEPGLPPTLCAVVERAMAREPAARYPHLDAMRTDLLRIASQLSPGAAAALTHRHGPDIATPQSPPLVWSRALDPTIDASAPATPADPRVPATSDAGQRHRPRRPPWALASGAGGLVVAAAVAVWVARGTGPPAPEGAVPSADTTVTRSGSTTSGRAATTPDLTVADGPPATTPDPAPSDGPSQAEAVDAARNQVTRVRRLLDQGNWDAAYKAARVAGAGTVAPTPQLEDARDTLRSLQVTALARARDEAGAAEQRARAAGVPADRLRAGRQQIDAAGRTGTRDPGAAIATYANAARTFVALADDVAAAETSPSPAPAESSAVLPPAPTEPRVAASGEAQVPAGVGSPPERNTPSAPSAPIVSDDEAIQSVLTRWARAFSTRDAAAIGALQPGIAGAIGAQLKELRSVEVLLSGCRITANAAQATAVCAERFSSEDRFGTPTVLPRTRTFTLQKRDGGWLITDARISR